MGAVLMGPSIRKVENQSVECMGSKGSGLWEALVHEGSLRCRTVMKEAKGTCWPLLPQERTIGSQQSTIWTVALTRT